MSGIQEMEILNKIKIEALKKKQEEKEEKELQKKKEKEEKEAQKKKEKEQKEKEIEELKALKELEKQEKESKKKRELQNIFDSSEAEYLKQKREIEKKWFIVRDMGCFAMFDKERNKFILHNEKSARLNLACYTIDEPSKFGVKTISVFDKWIKDSERRAFDSVIFDPQQKNKNDFNTFTGFKYDETENPKKSTKEIHKLLDHLLKPSYKKYLLEWLSFILKYKKRSNVGVLLYSHKHGVGKNSVIELIRKIIDDKYSSRIETIEELTKEFNSFIESKIFIYGDEIKAKNIDMCNALKNAVTRSEVKINNKGIKEYILDNFVNWFFTTNDRVPFKIEKNDRRWSILECNEKVLSKELAKEFYDALEDEEIMCSFYHELLSLNPPEKMECLDTPLKREIQNAYMPSPIKYLFKNYKQLEGTKWSINDLFEEIKKYEKTLGFTELKTSNQMSNILSEVGDFKFKNNDKRGYRFKDLDIVLKKYNEELFLDFQDVEDEHDDLEVFN